MPPKPTLYREVGTSEPAGDGPKINRSASKWKKTDLDLLGVDYRYDVFDDIRIPIEDAEMSPEFLQGNDLVMMN